jgi:ADP-heptose:LPS heptosyltransferase
VSQSVYGDRRYSSTEVGRELQQQYGGTVVVIGGTDECNLAQRLAQGIDGASLNLAGRKSLAVLGAVLEQLAVLVTNDSGPAHVAYALSTPTVTVFGGTNPAVWGPLEADQHAVLAHEVSCRPCDYVECPVGYTCLEGVTVHRVVEAAQTVMGESHSR